MSPFPDRDADDLAGDADLAEADDLAGDADLAEAEDLAAAPSDRSSSSRAGDASLETTHVLLGRIREGDDEARERLVRRFLPGLRRWAHGRLPERARGLSETNDLVQLALLRALDRVDLFEAGRGGAFLAYLHQILLNLIRDEVRKAQRRPAEPLPEGEVEDLVVTRADALARTVGVGAVQAYEAALELLTDDQRQAVILRLEFGFTYPEIAAALGRSSANGVRMQIGRALAQLAKAMHDYRTE